MTYEDQTRVFVLSGYVATRLADGNLKLALFDIAVGIGLLAVMHWLEEINWLKQKLL